jgi:hypothetical protein
MESVGVMVDATGCRNHRPKAFTDYRKSDHKRGVLEGTPLVFWGEPSG